MMQSFTRHLPIATALLLALLLLRWPTIDLWFSALFYHPETGFFLRDRVWAVFIYHATNGVTLIALLGLLTALLLPLLPAIRARWQPPLQRAQLLYLLFALLLGPGLLVNEVLKNHWDRARPSQVTEFGGGAQFTPPLLPADECAENCSFVSGHAAMGFILLAIGYATGRRRRWLLLALVVGGVIGMVRIVQGGHFLSDVIFSFYAVWGSSALLYRSMQRWLSPNAPI